MCRFKTVVGGQINYRKLELDSFEKQGPFRPPKPFFFGGGGIPVPRIPVPMPVTIEIFLESELLRPIFILEIQ